MSRNYLNIPPLQAHARVRRGIPVGEIKRFCGTMHLTQGELAGLLGVPVRTYQRWLSHADKRLDATFSSRYWRIAKVFQHAVDLLGSPDEALAWLRREQRALGYQVPFDLLATEPGAEAVEDLLGRIEYGVIT